MRVSSKLISQPRLRRGLLALGALYALGIAAANAQNLDQGKSATELFANGCEECHRSPASLARGRSRAALFQFLQEHYSSSSSTAAELASYLASFNPPPSSRSRPAVNNQPRSAPRPPGPRSVHAHPRHAPHRIQTEKPPTGPAAAGRSFP